MAVTGKGPKTGSAYFSSVERHSAACRLPHAGLWASWYDWPPARNLPSVGPLNGLQRAQSWGHGRRSEAHGRLWLFPVPFAA